MPTHVPQLISAFEAIAHPPAALPDFTSMLRKQQRGLDTVLPTSISTPQHKSKPSQDTLTSPHGFMSPTKQQLLNTSANTTAAHDDLNTTYTLPAAVSRDPQELMEQMMNGEYRHVPASDCITMMRDGQLFFTYIESNTQITRRQWVCHYNDANTADAIGTLFFSEPGTKNEQTNRFLNLNKLTDIHLGRRPVMLQRTNVPECDNEQCCFSLYSDNRIFDLEAKSVEQLCAWLFGINSIMSQSARNIVQADDGEDEADAVMISDTVDRSRQTLAKRYSVMQPVRQSMRNMSMTPADTMLSYAAHGVPAPVSDDATVNEWAAQQQAMLQKQKQMIGQLHTPVQAVLNELAQLKAGVQNDMDDMSVYIRDSMLLMSKTVRKLQSSKADVETELVTEQTKRKKLQNQIIELQGNIRVFCRVRPGNTTEANNNDPCCVDFKSDESLMIAGKTFEFDRVYDQASTQGDVYADVSPFVQSCVDGFNVCVFAYGQTGAGKSYTMEGPAGDRGVNYRALGELFDTVDVNNAKTNDRLDKVSYDINISVVEIYNETIRDLLIDKKVVKEEKKLDVRTGPHGVYIPDLTEMQVHNVEQVTRMMSTLAYPNRHVRGTDMNAHSSRSHLVMFVRVHGHNVNSDMHTYGKLILIDLAGSERVGKSGATGDSLKEAQSINSSLSSLGLVINALQNKQSHIPYRDSKLTYLLQDCLGGNSKCLMFCQLSPATSSQQESVCSLQFAQRARSTELGKAKKNVASATAGAADKSAKLMEKLRSDSKDEVMKVEKRLRAVQDEMHDKDDLIRQLQRENAAVKSLQGEITALKEQLKQQHSAGAAGGVSKISKPAPYVRHTLKSRGSVMPAQQNSHADDDNMEHDMPESSDGEMTAGEQENTVGNLVETTPKMRSAGHKRKETPSQDEVQMYAKKGSAATAATAQPALGSTARVRTLVASTRVGTARAGRVPAGTSLAQTTTLSRPFTSPAVSGAADDGSVSGMSRADEMRKRMTERKQRAAQAQAGTVQTSASKAKKPAAWA